MEFTWYTEEILVYTVGSLNIGMPVSGVYISWKALTKWLGKVEGLLGNLEAPSFHLNFFWGGVTGDKMK